MPSAGDRARRFLVLPFRNVSRTAELDWLVEGSTAVLSEQLGTWEGISVVPDERLYPALKKAGITPGTVVEAPRVRAVSEETGGWTAVTGDIISTGGRVRVSARAWDVPTNRELVRVASEVPATADIRVAYDSVTRQLLKSVGLDRAGADVAEGSTRNVDAYRAYLTGLALARKGDPKGAVAAFEQAVKADSMFAFAWARLAETAGELDGTQLFTPGGIAERYAARAASLAGKLPPRQRDVILALDAMFHAQFTDARRLLEGVLAIDSLNIEAMEQLTGLEMFDPILVARGGGVRPRGSLNRAAILAKRISQLDPSRSQVFGILATIFAGVGVPGMLPTFGFDRAPSSFAEMMQFANQRERLRVFVAVLHDTLVLVPIESLSVIPDDSLKSMRKRARVAGKAWGARWVAVSPGDAAPHQMMSELHRLDSEFAPALAELNRADSIGVKNPSYSVPARRMQLLAQTGNLARAAQLADSLTAAGFFADPNNVISNGDAVVWAFTMHTLTGRVGRASAMLDQHVRVLQAINPTATSPSIMALGKLLGPSSPDLEPGVSRAIRMAQIDSVARQLDAFLADPRLGPFMAVVLPGFVTGAKKDFPRAAGRVLDAASTLATQGKTNLAFHFAYNTVESDTAAERRAATYDWYRAGITARNATLRENAARFTPVSARVTTDSVVFEWKADDSKPFLWNRPEIPLGGTEYSWGVMVGGESRYFRFAISPSDRPPGPQGSGTLAALLGPQPNRSTIGGMLVGDSTFKDTTVVASVTPHAASAPGVFRMVVTEKSFVDWMRRVRPAVARMRMTPCAREIGDTRPCPLGDRVTVTYQ